MVTKTIKQQYDEWVSKVCSFLVEESLKLNVTCGTFQSKPILDYHPDVVFLGYNPHETGSALPLETIQARFYEGNREFYSDKRKDWSIWEPLRWSFEWAGYTKPVEDGHFVFFNAIYFGTNNINDFKKLPNSKILTDQCLHFSGEVIQNIFKPKCVVCLSVPDCFDILNRKFHFSDVKRVNTLQDTDANLIKYAMEKTANGWKIPYCSRRIIKKGLWNGISTYGIPHPSGSLSNNDRAAIALYLRSEMQNLGL